MTHLESILPNAKLLIEREDGFQPSHCEQLHQGSIYFINDDRELPRIKRALSDPQPVFNQHKHLIEWQVETTYEI